MRIIFCFIFPRFHICSPYKYEERTQIWPFSCLSWKNNNMTKFFLSRMEWYAPITPKCTNINHLWPHPPELGVRIGLTRWRCWKRGGWRSKKKTNLQNVGKKRSGRGNSVSPTTASSWRSLKGRDQWAPTRCSLSLSENNRPFSGPHHSSQNIKDKVVVLYESH